MFYPYQKETEILDFRYNTLKEACKYSVLSTVQPILEPKSPAILDQDPPKSFAQNLPHSCLFEAFR